MTDRTDVPPTSTAFRYMTRFRCLGPQCEASCCEGWTVTLDKKHYELTKEAMSGTPETRQEFDEKVERVKGPTRSKARHAVMVLNNNGTCSFLASDRLCSLQTRYGEEVLSNTCAQYPRFVSQSGARWELSGTASCPEVARQLLLHADALELDEVPPEALSRRHVRQQLPDHPSVPYVRYHDELRNLVLDVLSDPRFDLGTRLAQVAWFADRTRPFLNRETKVLDEARLSAEIDLILDPGHRLLLARELAAITPAHSMVVRLALAFIMRRASGRLFEALRAPVMRGYAPSLQSDEVADGDLDRVGEEILQNYRERKARLAPYARRIDQSLTNYAKSFWIRSWYFISPDLLAHHMELLVQLSVVRFLVLGHPLLAELESESEAQRGALIDAAIVDSVMRFSRNFEHSEAGLKLLREALQKKQLVTLAHTVSAALF